MNKISPLSVTAGNTLLVGERIITATGPGVPGTDWTGRQGHRIPIVVKRRGRADQFFDYYVYGDVTLLDKRPEGW